MRRNTIAAVGIDHFGTCIDGGLCHALKGAIAQLDVEVRETKRHKGLRNILWQCAAQLLRAAARSEGLGNVEYLRHDIFNA